MIWLRASLLALMVGLLVLAVTQANPPSTSESRESSDAATPQPPQALTAPTARASLVPTQQQMVISRVARETPPPPATATALAQPRVSIVDNGYLPGQQELRVGDTLSWVNTGSDGHDVTGTGPGGAWRSGPLAPSERYERPFNQPGTYDYACSIHPEMRGQILVHP